MELQDTYRHKGLRKELVQLLAGKGITSGKVLNAIDVVPRHLFFQDTIFDRKAYEDKAFPIGEGQTISQPFTVAYQTQLLDVQVGEKVMEIGTGSGYQAAVLAAMGAKVYSVERQKKLYERTRPFLLALGYTNIKCFFGDGFEGIPTFAPYDKIIVTAAAPEIPLKLLAQLKIGGVLVIPLGKGATQKMLRITKRGEKDFEQEIYEDFAFVPMLKGKAY